MRTSCSFCSISAVESRSGVAAVRMRPEPAAVDGFVAAITAVAREHDPAFRAPYVSPGLAEQIVVGHQQYQLVMHREGAFRRAFSEVLRRRSLLFIGSGLQEDYLLNLFGEVQIMHGPGSLPHYALMRESAQLEVSAALLARTLKRAREADRDGRSDLNRLSLTIAFYKRNYIEGLFLSSGIVKSPDHSSVKSLSHCMLLSSARQAAG